MGVPPNLRFSNGRSFRLFTEGVQALKAYEQNAQKASLENAAGKFSECVSNYKDVLPRLYLGIVRYYQGEAIDEAVSWLTEVLERNIPELIPTAKYYLAEAYVSKYTTDDIDHANTIIAELLSECKTESVDPRLASLRAQIQLQAESLQAFTLVRQNLWKKSTGSEDLTAVERQATEQLDQFRTDLQNADLPADVRASLLADYQNTRGLLEEYRAHRAKDEKDKIDLANKSLSYFKEAARYGANKADALSNQARVYQQLLKEDKEAIRLAKEVLEIRENDSFANLLLGRIYESDQPEFAVHYYLKAAKFLEEGAFGAGRCYEKLEDFDSALHYYLKAQAKFPEESALGASRCYEKLEDFTSALQELGKVKSKGFFGQASYRSGVIQERLGKTKEACESFAGVPAEDTEYFGKAQEKLASLPKT